MKIDCSITENYLKELERSGRTLNMNRTGTPKQEVENMQEWSDANEQKTYIEDLLEKYPDIPLDDNGFPVGLHPHNFGLKNISWCHCIVDKSTCKKCWDQVMEVKNA